MPVVISGSAGISGVVGSASTPAITGSSSNSGLNFENDSVNISIGSSNRLNVDEHGNVIITGIVTATSFSGNITGTATSATTATTATYASTAGIATYASTAGISTVAQGLTGTPNITVGTVTANAINASGTVGSASSVLTSSGSGIYWSAPASGAWEFIGEASGNAANMTFSGITTAYETYAFVLSDTGPVSANGVPVSVSFSEDGVSYGLNTKYTMLRIFNGSASTTVVNQAAGSFNFNISQDQTIGGNGGGFGIMYLSMGFHSGFDRPRMTYQYGAPSSDYFSVTGTATLVNGLTSTPRTLYVRFTAGTQIGGKIRLYGIKNS